jgi:hypothetical protein
MLYYRLRVVHALRSGQPDLSEYVKRVLLYHAEYAKRVTLKHIERVAVPAEKFK